jgi:hypothetical protein
MLNESTFYVWTIPHTLDLHNFAAYWYAFASCGDRESRMQGYLWAKTPQQELFIVLVVDGKGYVPGVENAIDLFQIEFLEPVQWPSTLQNRNSVPPKPGALAPGAMHVCGTPPYVANVLLAF